MRWMRLVLVVSALEVQAQESCLPDETPAQCFARVVTARVAAQGGGPVSLDGPVRSTLKDFLALLSTHLDAPVVGSEPRRLTLSQRIHPQLRAEAELIEPRVSELTKQTASAATLAQLEDSLTALDDVAVGLTFAPSTRRFGRHIAPHEALVASLATESIPTPLADAFAVLLGNQPQLYATAKHRFRNDVVGPREWEGRVTWELGTRNLNGFLRSEGRDCIARNDCAAALAAYVARASSDVGRLTFSLAYRDTEHIAGAAVVPTRLLEYEAAYGIPYADGRIELRYKFANEIDTGSIAQVMPLEAQRVPDFEERAFRPTFERQIAALTYTQPINERLSIPVSVVYSDRRHFVPEEETKETGMSVHAGLVYRIVPRRAKPPCACCC